ncbi:MAG: rod shape-determining protein [Oligoflexus sp.]
MKTTWWRHHIQRWAGADIAIDLGTSNTLLFARGDGIIMDEPSIVATRRDRRGKLQIIAVGEEAERMQGRTNEKIRTTQPLRDGVIADLDLAEKMLQSFFKRLGLHRSFGRPKIVIGAPFDTTALEKRAVQHAAAAAGAKRIVLLEEPIAAAIGVGLPLKEPLANMLVDIGSGTTEVVVLSQSGIAHSQSVRIGGQKMDEAIVRYVRRKYDMDISVKTAEQAKIAIGNAMLPSHEMSVVIKGYHHIRRLPYSVKLTAQDIHAAIEDSVQAIIKAVKLTLETTEPEMCCDLYEQGIVLAGGGALLTNMDRRIAEATQLPVRVSEAAMSAVALGAGAVLEEVRKL